jgi:hypothetical protein
MQKTSTYLPPSTPPKRPPKKQKTDHHITELDAAPSLISNFSDLQSSLLEAKPLPLKESDRGNMSRTRDRTPKLTPPHDYSVGGQEIRIAGLHPQTQHARVCGVTPLPTALLVSESDHVPNPGQNRGVDWVCRATCTVIMVA